MQKHQKKKTSTVIEMDDGGVNHERHIPTALLINLYSSVELPTHSLSLPTPVTIEILSLESRIISKR